MKIDQTGTALSCGSGKTNKILTAQNVAAVEELV